MVSLYLRNGLKDFDQTFCGYLFYENITQKSVCCWCGGGPVCLLFLLTPSSDCIIEALANPEKEKMKHDDTTISSWLQSEWLHFFHLIGKRREPF